MRLAPKITVTRVLGFLLPSAPQSQYASGAYPEHLAVWVNVQRLFHMRGKLRLDRARRLEVIGLV